MRDIEFLHSFTHALAVSEDAGRPVLVVPLGQGVGPEGDW